MDHGWGNALWAGVAKEEEGMLLLLRCGNLLEDWCEECVDCRVFSGIYDGDTKLGQGVRKRLG